MVRASVQGADGTATTIRPSKPTGLLVGVMAGVTAVVNTGAGPAEVDAVESAEPTGF